MDFSDGVACVRQRSFSSSDFSSATNCARGSAVGANPPPRQSRQAEIIPPAPLDLQALTSRLYELDKIFGPFGSNAAHPSDLHSQPDFREAVRLLALPERAARHRAAVRRRQQLVAVERGAGGAEKPSGARQSGRAGAEAVSRTFRHGRCISRLIFCSTPNREFPSGRRSPMPRIGGSRIAGCRIFFAIISPAARSAAMPQRLAARCGSRATSPNELIRKFLQHDHASVGGHADQGDRRRRRCRRSRRRRPRTTRH